MNAGSAPAATLRLGLRPRLRGGGGDGAHTLGNSCDRIWGGLRDHAHLSRLGMDAAAECLAGKLGAAQKEKPSYADFLDALLGAEVAAVEAKSAPTSS